MIVCFLSFFFLGATDAPPHVSHEPADTELTFVAGGMDAQNAWKKAMENPRVQQSISILEINGVLRRTYTQQRGFTYGVAKDWQAMHTQNLKWFNRYSFSRHVFSAAILVISALAGIGPIYLQRANKDDPVFSIGFASMAASIISALGDAIFYDMIVQSQNEIGEVLFAGLDVQRALFSAFYELNTDESDDRRSYSEIFGYEDLTRQIVWSPRAIDSFKNKFELSEALSEQQIVDTMQKIEDSTQNWKKGAKTLRGISTSSGLATAIISPMTFVLFAVIHFTYWLNPSIRMQPSGNSTSVLHTTITTMAPVYNTTTGSQGIAQSDFNNFLFAYGVMGPISILTTVLYMLVRIATLVTNIKIVWNLKDRTKLDQIIDRDPRPITNGVRAARDTSRASARFSNL